MAEARSMILEVLIFLSRVDSVVDVCEKTQFFSQRVSPTSFNIFPFKERWCFSACDCDVRQKALP